MAEQNTVTKPRKEEAGNLSRAIDRRPVSGGILRRDPFWPSSEFFGSSPFGLMRRFAEQMERAFFNDWSPDFGAERAGSWLPPIDVSERDGKLVVRADLPGLKKDDVKVEALDGSLVIHGERQTEHEEHREGYRRMERGYGSFYRTVPLPEGAQTEQARAEFKDGVLEITVPVPADQKRGHEVPIVEVAASSAGRKETASENTGQTRSSKAV